MSEKPSGYNPEKNGQLAKELSDDDKKSLEQISQDLAAIEEIDDSYTDGAETFNFADVKKSLEDILPRLQKKGVNLGRYAGIVTDKLGQITEKIASLDGLLDGKNDSSIFDKQDAWEQLGFVAQQIVGVLTTALEAEKKEDAVDKEALETNEDFILDGGRKITISVMRAELPGVLATLDSANYQQALHYFDLVLNHTAELRKSLEGVLEEEKQSIQNNLDSWDEIRFALGKAIKAADEKNHTATNKTQTAGSDVKEKPAPKNDTKTSEQSEITPPIETINPDILAEINTTKQSLENTNIFSGLVSSWDNNGAKTDYDTIQIKNTMLQLFDVLKTPQNETDSTNILNTINFYKYIVNNAQQYWINEQPKYVGGEWENWVAQMIPTLDVLLKTADSMLAIMDDLKQPNYRADYDVVEYKLSQLVANESGGTYAKLAEKDKTLADLLAEAARALAADQDEQQAGAAINWQTRHDGIEKVLAEIKATKQKKYNALADYLQNALIDIDIEIRLTKPDVEDDETAEELTTEEPEAVAPSEPETAANKYSFEDRTHDLVLDTRQMFEFPDVASLEAQSSDDLKNNYLNSLRNCPFVNTAVIDTLLNRLTALNNLPLGSDEERHTHDQESKVLHLDIAYEINSSLINLQVDIFDQLKRLATISKINNDEEILQRVVALQEEIANSNLPFNEVAARVKRLVDETVVEVASPENKATTMQSFFDQKKQMNTLSGDMTYVEYILSGFTINGQTFDNFKNDFLSGERQEIAKKIERALSSHDSVVRAFSHDGIEQISLDVIISQFDAIVAMLQQERVTSPRDPDNLSDDDFAALDAYRTQFLISLKDNYDEYLSKLSDERQRANEKAIADMLVIARGLSKENQEKLEQLRGQMGEYYQAFTVLMSYDSAYGLLFTPDMKKEFDVLFKSFSELGIKPDSYSKVLIDAGSKSRTLKEISDNIENAGKLYSDNTVRDRWRTYARKPTDRVLRDFYVHNDAIKAATHSGNSAAAEIGLKLRAAGIAYSDSSNELHVLGLLEAAKSIESRSETYKNVMKVYDMLEFTFDKGVFDNGRARFSDPDKLHELLDNEGAFGVALTYNQSFQVTGRHDFLLEDANTFSQQLSATERGLIEFPVGSGRFTVDHSQKETKNKRSFGLIRSMSALAIAYLCTNKDKDGKYAYQADDGRGEFVDRAYMALFDDPTGNNLKKLITDLRAIQQQYDLDVQVYRDYEHALSHPSPDIARNETRINELNDQAKRINDQLDELEEKHGFLMPSKRLTNKKYGLIAQVQSIAAEIKSLQTANRPPTEPKIPVELPAFLTQLVRDLPQVLAQIQSFTNESYPDGTLRQPNEIARDREELQLLRWQSRNVDWPFIGGSLFVHEWTMRQTGCAYNIQAAHATNKGLGSEGAMVYRLGKPSVDNYMGLGSAINDFALRGGRKKESLLGSNFTDQEIGELQAYKGVDRYMAARQAGVMQLIENNPYAREFVVGVDRLGNVIAPLGEDVVYQRFDFARVINSDFEGNPEYSWMYDQPEELNTKSLSAFDKVVKGIVDLETWAFSASDLEPTRINQKMSEVGTACSLVLAWVGPEGAKPMPVDYPGGQEAWDARCKQVQDAWRARYQFLYDKIFAFISFKIVRLFGDIKLDLVDTYNNLNGDNITSDVMTAQASYELKRTEIASALRSGLRNISDGITINRTNKTILGDPVQVVVEKNDNNDDVEVLKVKQQLIYALNDNIDRCESVDYDQRYNQFARERDKILAKNMTPYNKTLGLFSSTIKPVNLFAGLGSYKMDDGSGKK